MQKNITSIAIPTTENKGKALGSFEQFCLATGMEALAGMMEGDAVENCSGRHERSRWRTAYRWGKTRGKIGFHGGNVEIKRPRLHAGTVRNLVCGAIVEPQEAGYGDQEGYTRPASFRTRSEGGFLQGRAFR